MTFYDQLVAATQPQREVLYSVPQLRAGLAGQIDRAAYIAYLTQAYHHVKHTVPFLMTMGAALPEKHRWLHDAIASYITEEKGHEQWILNDITAAGGDADAAAKSTPALATQVLVAYNYNYMARHNPIGFLGMVFMLESTSTQMATAGASALRQNLALPQEAFSYLFSHGSLDISHIAFFEQLVNQITDPADQVAIIEVAQNTFLLFADVLRSVPMSAKEMNHAS